MNLKLLITATSIFTTLCSCDTLIWEQNSSIVYNGVRYSYLRTLPIAFDKDTIYPEVWYSTFNVDGDNRRIIRNICSNDTTTIVLPNAVNNYTTMIVYALKVDKKRYLWLEDNFGTTVLDIDSKKKRTVAKHKKQLTEVAPTGAPIGVMNKLSIPEMRRRLGLTKRSNIIILDSLEVTH